MKKGKE